MGQMSFSTSALCLLTFATFVAANVPSFGRCPVVEPMDNFNMGKYWGVWYETLKYASFEDIGLRCIYVKYTPGNNNTVNVTRAAIGLFSTSSVKNGTARIIAPGQLDLSYASNATASEEPNYVVLQTDYMNYAVVYSCTEYTKLINFSNVWILTRDRNPDVEILKKARKVIEKKKIPADLLVDINQTDCDCQAVKLLGK